MGVTGTAIVIATAIVALRATATLAAVAVIVALLASVAVVTAALVAAEAGRHCRSPLRDAMPHHSEASRRLNHQRRIATDVTAIPRTGRR